ncbi:MAG TPA: hypothetical protein VJA21_05620 [Verrucomicrobiae bacterium]
MKTLVQRTAVGAFGAAALLLGGAGNAWAQNPPSQGNFDPAQMRQRMSERMREQFGVTDESEWKLIFERINKVMEARRSSGGFGGPGGFGGGFMRSPGGPGGAGGPPQQPGPGQQNAGGPPPQGGPGGAGGFGGGPGGPGGPPFVPQVSPEMDALRKAIEAKAPAEELKARIAGVKAARAKNQAALEKAQQELKQVLSVNQEAVATSMGLLN